MKRALMLLGLVCSMTIGCGSPPHAVEIEQSKTKALSAGPGNFIITDTGSVPMGGFRVTCNGKTYITTGWISQGYHRFDNRSFYSSLTITLSSACRIGSFHSCGRTNACCSISCSRPPPLRYLK